MPLDGLPGLGFWQRPVAIEDEPKLSHARSREIARAHFEARGAFGVHRCRAENLSAFVQEPERRRVLAGVGTETDGADETCAERESRLVQSEDSWRRVESHARRCLSAIDGKLGFGSVEQSVARVGELHLRVSDGKRRAHAKVALIPGRDRVPVRREARRPRTLRARLCRR